MIQSRLFRKQFVIAAASVLVCVLLGTALLAFVARITAPEPEPRRFQTPSLFVNFIENEFAGDHARAMEKLASYLQADPIRLYLLDEHGTALYPPSAKLPGIEALPKAEHETVSSGAQKRGSPMLMITRLRGEPARYLVTEMRGGPGRPPGFGGPPPPPHLRGARPPGPMGPPPPFHGLIGYLFFPASFLTLVLMVLAGIGLGLAVIHRSLRSTSHQADRVISELKSGNLKARFPIERDDEIGAAMRRFNAMADEIEKLVERLRLAESARNNLLQELTHDLRTPVASLRTLLEGIFRNVPLKGEEAELAELAEKEVEYLGRLVEDLLLLAQLTEPRFKAARGYVDILSLLEQECEALARRQESPGIEVVTNFGVEEVLVLGDEHLFERLVRNALENAFAHAKSRVRVDVSEASGDALKISIRDDGAGFSPEELARFGERREQRLVQQKKNGKVSLGLGSVIMKSVAALHGGAITAANAPGGGAIVEITLPKSA